MIVKLCNTITRTKKYNKEVDSNVSVHQTIITFPLRKELFLFGCTNYGSQKIFRLEHYYYYDKENSGKHCTEQALSNALLYVRSVNDNHFQVNDNHFQWYIDFMFFGIVALLEMLFDTLPVSKYFIHRVDCVTNEFFL